MTGLDTAIESSDTAATSSKVETIAFDQLRPFRRDNPPMRDDRFARLVQDIEKNGQIVPIVIWGCFVLDGWHRLKACRQLGRVPKYEIFEGDEDAAEKRETAFNRNRRQLTAGQIACYRVLDRDLKRAAKRGGNRSAVGLAELETIGQLALTAEVSATYIKQATKLAQCCPDLFREVVLGTKNLSTAYRECCPQKEKDKEKASSCGCIADCTHDRCPHAAVASAFVAEIAQLKSVVASLAKQLENTQIAA